MSGQTNLQEILNSITISCDDTEYGFGTTSEMLSLSSKDIWGAFQEAEGVTVIATVQYLGENHVSFEGPFAKLSIEAHTSLELVGLTAALSAKLAEKNISANVVAAYYHDHIFVPFNLRSTALDALHSLKA